MSKLDISLFWIKLEKTEGPLKNPEARMTLSATQRTKTNKAQNTIMKTIKQHGDHQNKSEVNPNALDSQTGPVSYMAFLG